MCAILDANTFHKFKDTSDEDMKPVWKWLENKRGKIIYANTKKFEEEWYRGGMDLIRDQLMRSGQLKLVSQDIQEKESELNDLIRSDDPHIIALAVVGDVKILISDDRRLIQDFKEHVSQGKVYKTKGHKHLLTKDTCP